MASIEAIPVGTTLTGRNGYYRNPGTGIPYKDAFKVVGKRAGVNIAYDVYL